MSETKNNEFGKKLRDLRKVISEQDWTDDGRFVVPSNPSKNYTYVTADKAKKNLNAAMMETGLEIIVRYSDLQFHPGIGSMTQHVTVICHMTVYDPDTPDTGIVFEAFGEAADSGDKAVNKAQTDGIKQIIFNVWLVADNSDPDRNISDIEAPAVGRQIPPTPEQKAEAFQQLKAKATPAPTPVQLQTTAPVAIPKADGEQGPTPIQLKAMERIVSALTEDKENGTLTGGEYDAIMSEKDAIKTSKDAAEFIIKHRRQ